MTKLKFDLVADATCTLTITDNTGFTTDNITGFVLETATVVPIGDYKISNGFFVDVVSHKDYKTGKIVTAKGDFKTTISESVLPVYANNFISETYKFKQDGTHTFSKVFIVAKQYYIEERISGRFAGKIGYYYDVVDEKVYKVTSEHNAIEMTSVASSLAEMISEPFPTTSLITSNTFISTCYLNLCYFTLMHKIILEECDLCKGNATRYGTCSDDDDLIKKRDFLFMTIESIAFMQELGMNIEIEKTIQAVNVCGGFCKDLLTINSNNSCNCG